MVPWLFTNEKKVFASSNGSVTTKVCYKFLKHNITFETVLNFFEAMR